MTHFINNIILASSSPYRKQQFAKLGLAFSTFSPNVDESRKSRETPKELVERLSLEKVLEVRKRYPDAVIIGSDQVAYIMDEQSDLSTTPVLSKPITKENAQSQLMSCSGRTVTFITGLCCSSPKHGEHIASETVNVTFRRLSFAEVERYIERELPLDCAGSFKVEGLGITLFDKVESNDPSTLIGLPLITLNKILIKFGLNALLYL